MSYPGVAGPHNKAGGERANFLLDASEAVSEPQKLEVELRTNAPYQPN